MGRTWIVQTDNTTTRDRSAPTSQKVKFEVTLAAHKAMPISPACCKSPGAQLAFIPTAPMGPSTELAHAPRAGGSGKAWLLLPSQPDHNEA